jgi:hypothetical protein
LDAARVSPTRIFPVHVWLTSTLYCVTVCPPDCQDGSADCVI